jgi:hypothetical protein
LRRSHPSEDGKKIVKIDGQMIMNRARPARRRRSTMRPRPPP